MRAVAVGISLPSRGAAHGPVRSDQGFSAIARSYGQIAPLASFSVGPGSSSSASGNGAPWRGGAPDTVSVTRRPSDDHLPWRTTIPDQTHTTPAGQGDTRSLAENPLWSSKVM